jgi:hypothetical protein
MDRMVTAMELDALLNVAQRRGVSKMGIATMDGRFRLDVEFTPAAPPATKDKPDEPEPRRALDLLGDIVAGTDRVEYPPGAEPGIPLGAPGQIGWATDNPAKEK